MTEEEWLNSTDEEKRKEYIRCQDPWYCYTNYYRLVPGSKPMALNRETWDKNMDLIGRLMKARFKRLGYE